MTALFRNGPVIGATEVGVPVKVGSAVAIAVGVRVAVTNAVGVLVAALVGVIVDKGWDVAVFVGVALGAGAPPEIGVFMSVPISLAESARL